MSTNSTKDIDACHLSLNDRVLGKRIQARHSPKLLPGSPSFHMRLWFFGSSGLWRAIQPGQAAGSCSSRSSKSSTHRKREPRRSSKQTKMQLSAVHCVSWRPGPKARVTAAETAEASSLACLRSAIEFPSSYMDTEGQAGAT